jgi:D-inositol-3-phosphate glycosyltransferase
MVPLFLVLAAPFAKVLRVRLVLWYTHWHASRLLRLATYLADTVLSADAGSFPLRSPKVRGIGHAVDIHRFAPSAQPRPREGGLRLLGLGRYAEVKGYPTLLEGLRLALERGIDATLELRGPELTPVESRHRAELDRIVGETAALRGRVTFAQAIPHDEVPALLRDVDVLVSATQPTSSETFDKVLCEGAACGLPVVASNRALGAFLGGFPLELRFPAGDATALADIIERLAEAGPAIRVEIGAELRRRVVADHSVESWADAVLAAVAGGAPE